LKKRRHVYDFKSIFKAENGENWRKMAKMAVLTQNAAFYGEIHHGIVFSQKNPS
jgi:hypothetical protein